MVRYKHYKIPYTDLKPEIYKILTKMVTIMEPKYPQHILPYTPTQIPEDKRPPWLGYELALPN